ncbi:unnamed protein product [Rotaria sp. Silwood1]|nr:unnamed protein product [Rotaria sp. Silwood1]CAF1659252.1 unnamed protein product [Rotaria sp. Silwood1]CAF3910351.1 unnamed protein product [Rotaria sp. Silwood1]CAF3964530.1 unnamed protein product [Rotaria sp. Silwood1]CAF5154071.1 unnamed protein product [Rotaria sp. Silwood1]
MWLSEKCHLLQTYSDLIFNNKQQTLMDIRLLKHYPSRANEFQQRLEQLAFNNNNLKQTIKQHRQQIGLLEHLYQYYYASSNADAWLGEQELYTMSEERGKGELTT